MAGLPFGTSLGVDSRDGMGILEPAPQRGRVGSLGYKAQPTSGVRLQTANIATVIRVKALQRLASAA
jgi:hypothetical protein